MRVRRAILAVVTTLWAAGCADRLANADHLAAPAGLVRREVSTATFRLTTYSRDRDTAAPVVVYIEGDGLAWKSRSEPSADPTPAEAMGLRLAALDPSPNVLYLARPCQFTRNDSRCAQTYWTDRRFAEEVVTGMNQAIDLAARGRRLHLVGYSGGGAIAALIAARRNDVASLRTVAGNLDHDAVNRFHDVSPMRGSLNAINLAAGLATLPQEHFVGGADEVVPAFVAEAFVRAVGNGDCAKVVRVEGATHTDGWANAWRINAARVPTCRR